MLLLLCLLLLLCILLLLCLWLFIIRTSAAVASAPAAGVRTGELRYEDQDVIYGTYGLNIMDYIYYLWTCKNNTNNDKSNMSFRTYAMNHWNKHVWSGFLVMPVFSPVVMNKPGWRASCGTRIGRVLVYVCMYLCMCMYMYIYIYMCIYICPYIYIYMCVYMYIYIEREIYIRIYIYIYIHIITYTYIYIYNNSLSIHIYMYIYIYILIVMIMTNTHVYK